MNAREPEAYLRSGSNELKILEYSIGGLKLGINILKVSRVLDRPVQMSRPGGSAHSSVKGMFEDHGHIVPMVDLGHILGIESKSGGKRIIITEFFNDINGFLADSVERVLTLTWDRVKGANEVMQNLDNPYVLAIARPTDEDSILLIDYEKIVLELAPNLAGDKSVSQAEKDWEAGGRPILIAEDSTPVREMLTLEFEELNFTVIAAKDGEDAIAAFEENSDITLVVLDVEMPKKDGLAVLGHIRGHLERHKTPVLIYSSIGDIGMKERAKIMEADGHITKLEMNELVQHAKTALEKGKKNKR